LLCKNVVFVSLLLVIHVFCTPIKSSFDEIKNI
jgi:hypothetical protein